MKAPHTQIYVVLREKLIILSTNVKKEKLKQTNKKLNAVC